MSMELRKARNADGRWVAAWMCPHPLKKYSERSKSIVLTAHMPPKLIIFDLDGTLIEFPREFLHSETERLIADFGHPPVLRSALEESFYDFDYFRVIHEEKRAAFIKHFNHSFRWTEFPKPILFPNTIKLLEELFNNGVTTAIATARDQSNESLERELLETGITKYISIMATRLLEDQQWTDKRPQIRHILTEAGVSAAETMFVSDTPGDLQSARDEGIKTVIAVLSGGVSETVLRACNPCHILGGVGDLLESLLVK